MCNLCPGANDGRPHVGICSRCGHKGACWIIEDRPKPSWPSTAWRDIRVCYLCLAYAITKEIAS